MGASAREIEREIVQTRERMDDNLTRLEGQAMSKARRYGRIAVIVVGVLAVGGAALLIYRRTRRPTLRDRLDRLSIGSLRAAAAEASGRLKDRLPTVTVKINDQTEQGPGTMEGILRRVAPALVGTAGSALLQRVVAPPEDVHSTRAAE